MAGNRDHSPDSSPGAVAGVIAADAHRGDICIVERATGDVRMLATDVVTEDAHRVACQQWVLRGEQVVFHDLRDEHWLVIAVDVRSGAKRVLARGRQVGWGQVDGDLVPLYGPHWDPGEHELVHRFDNSQGAASWRRAHPHPVFSPDGRRIYFNVSSDK